MPNANATVVPLPLPAGPLSSRPDDDLMLLCGAGHRVAFEAIADRHLGPLVRFCAKLVGSPVVGEDLAQDALLEVWTRSPSYQPRGQFRAYLLRVARSRCYNHLRSARRGERSVATLAPQEKPDGIEPTDEGTISALLNEEHGRRVREALAHLPAKLREAVLLRFDQELDYREIARITGTFESTARSRVFHGLKKLRSRLGEEA